MARKGKNERGFKLLGLEPEDYLRWCDRHDKRICDATKKEFFKLALEYKIIRKDGQLVETE